MKRNVILNKAVKCTSCFYLSQFLSVLHFEAMGQLFLFEMLQSKSLQKTHTFLRNSGVDWITQDVGS